VIQPGFAGRPQDLHQGGQGRTRQGLRRVSVRFDDVRRFPAKSIGRLGGSDDPRRSHTPRGRPMCGSGRVVVPGAI